MKKNKMLRMASVLLVLTLLTTSIIGGTFAKYVTTDSATDTARVAKFGVVATASGDLFGSTYTNEDGGNTITTYSVNGGTVSAGDANTKVVAPGTKNDKGLTLSVAGTPEVSTKVTLEAAKGENDKNYVNSDIYLATGTYGVMVEYTGARTAANITQYYTYDSGTKKYTQATTSDVEADAVYELHDVAKVTDGAYYPLKWTVGTTKDIANVTAVTTSLKTALLGGDVANKEFNPNKAIELTTGSGSLSATVKWEWPFGNGTNDDKDTILGDMIAASLNTTDPIAVVAKADDGSYNTVTYKTEAAGTDSANQVVNAYVNNNTKVACLTAAFGASLTVEQVD